MLFGFLALSPVMLTRETYAARHASVLRNDWKGLLTIAIMNGFQIACNNASLTVMELSMNQVIRASIPVLVALLAVCIEAKVPGQGRDRVPGGHLARRDARRVGGVAQRHARHHP